jgi:hypothetical protein
MDRRGDCLGQFPGQRPLGGRGKDEVCVTEPPLTW